MKFSDFICTEAIQWQLVSEDKESVIRELVGSLVEAGKVAARDNEDMVEASGALIAL